MLLSACIGQWGFRNKSKRHDCCHINIFTDRSLSVKLSITFCTSFHLVSNYSRWNVDFRKSALDCSYRCFSSALSAQIKHMSTSFHCQPKRTSYQMKSQDYSMCKRGRQKTVKVFDNQWMNLKNKLLVQQPASINPLREAVSPAICYLYNHHYYRRNKYKIKKKTK